MKKLMKITVTLALLVIFSLGMGVQVKAEDNNGLIINGGYVEGYEGAGGVVVIPEDVYYISNSAFENNSAITEIILPGTMKELPMNVFKNCTSLRSVTLPPALTKLPSGAFWGCTSLESITIPESVTSIGSGAFWQCASLRTVQLPSGLTEIPYSCFGDCVSLESINFPANLSVIGEKAFENCVPLKNVILPSGLTVLGDRAFYGCSQIAEVTIPSGVSYVSDTCFDKNVKINHSMDMGKISEIYVSDFVKEVKEGRTFEVDAHFSMAGKEHTYESSDPLYRDMFEWSSSDESVIRSGMGENPGKFLAMKPGNATLTLKVGDEVKSFSVKVTDDKNIFYVIPEMRYAEKLELAETQGIKPTTKQEICNYVKDNLSKGNYNLAFYKTDAFSFDELEEAMYQAIAMYEYYLVSHNKPDRYTTMWTYDGITGKLLSENKKKHHYDSGHRYFIKDSADNQIMIWSMYNPNSVKQVEKLNDKSDAIIKKIIKDGMTPKQKMKAIHDYIVKNCSYDMLGKDSITIGSKTYYNKKQVNEVSHSAYGALISKKAVCDGYSHAFTLLCTKAGIPCVFVGGKGHAWNLVKLNGKYLYVDVTYDDPVITSKLNPKKPFAPAKNTKPYYQNFLISSEKFKKNHYFQTKDSYDGDTHTEKWYKALYESYVAMF